MKILKKLFSRERKVLELRNLGGNFYLGKGKDCKRSLLLSRVERRINFSLRYCYPREKEHWKANCNP